MQFLRVTVLVAAHLLVLLHSLVPHNHGQTQQSAGLLSRAFSLVPHASGGESFRYQVVQAQPLRQVQPVAAPAQQAVADADQSASAPIALAGPTEWNPSVDVGLNWSLRGPPVVC